MARRRHHNQILAITNGGVRATNALLTLHYDNGVKSYEMQQSIQPGDQMWVNVAELIRNRVPDRKGSVLPVDVNAGTYDLRDLTPAGDGLLESSLALDTTLGFQLGQQCPDCCGYEADSVSFNPYPADVVVDGIDQTAIDAVNACSDDMSDISSYFVTWGSYNPGIAAVTARQVKGVAPGATTGTSQGEIPTPGTCVCTLYSSQPAVPIAVQPTVTSISPAQGLVGTAIGVTISGSGFAQGATVDAGSNISVSNVSVSSSTQITATFTPTNSSSAGGSQAVKVTVAGQPSNTQNFFVQVPTHFQRYNQPPEAPGGLGPVTPLANGNVVDLLGNVLATHFCGVYENFLFDIADQQGNQIENGTVTVTEVFSNVTPPPGPTPATVSVPLSTNGVTDNQAYGFTYPTCLAKNQNQALDMTWTVQVGPTAYPITTVVHITKGNFNGALNVTSTITTQ